MIPRRRTSIDAIETALAWRRARADANATIERFELEFSNFTGTRHAIATCSGRAALLTALLAEGLKPGDEVILPAYTLGELATSLQSVGLIPVYADISPDTLLLDPDSVARSITANTRAVIPTDLFGAAAHWGERLGELAREANLSIIEDAAHATGTLFDGVSVGRTARATFFSLETIKLAHAYGGGVIVTDDGDLATAIRARLPRCSPHAAYVPMKFLKNAVENVLFRTPAFGLALLAMEIEAVRTLLVSGYLAIKRKGVPTQTSFAAWQAEFGWRQLESLPARIERRREIASLMKSKLDDLIRFQEITPRCDSNYYFLIGSIDIPPTVLRRKLIRNGIDIGIHEEVTDFCPPMEQAPLFPNAFRAYQRTIQLPLFDTMTFHQIERVAAAIRSVLTQ